MLRNAVSIAVCDLRLHGRAMVAKASRQDRTQELEMKPHRCNHLTFDKDVEDKPQKRSVYLFSK